GAGRLQLELALLAPGGEEARPVRAAEALAPAPREHREPAAEELDARRPEERLRGRVRVEDAALDVGDDHRVLGAVEDAAQERLALGGGLLRLVARDGRAED